MSFRKKVKHNVPKVALDSIMSLVVGSYKSGKTRLWKEVTELHYADPEEAMLLAFEPGYETWELENIIPVLEGYDEEEKPNKTGEDWEVWDYFRKVVVKGLVDEARDKRIVKLIGIDTADRAIDYCTAWVLHDAYKRYGNVYRSPQEISENTDENGWILIYNELKKQIDALRNAGYGIMSLAWTKPKETTLHDGRKYNSVELMMNNTGRKVFESQASFICCLFSEVNVLDKEGNVLDENKVNKKKKEVASNFHETKVVMYFRPSQYISIAGGRYTNLPEKVDYSAENYLQVFEEAVKGQLKKTTQSIDELEKEQQDQKDEKAKEFAEQQGKAEKLIDEIKITLNGLEKEKKQKAGVKFKKLFGTPNGYMKSEDVDKLQEAHEFLNTI